MNISYEKKQRNTGDRTPKDQTNEKSRHLTQDVCSFLRAEMAERYRRTHWRVKRVFR